MDGLSGASSAFAVVSLAIQIADSIKKFCDFWDSIQEAPKEIRIISNDLNIISVVLKDIQEEANNARPYSRALSASLLALGQCADSIESLQGFINDLEPGFSSEKGRIRKWSAFKAAWRRDKIRGFREGLRDMKLTLIMARQNSDSRMTLAYHESQQRDLTLIAQSMGLLLKERACRTVTTISAEGLDTDEHLDVLRKECHKSASAIANPIERFGCKSLIDSALSQISTDLESGILKEKDSTQCRHRDGQGINRQPSSTGHQRLRNKKAYRTRFECIFGSVDLLSTTWASLSCHWAENDVDDEHVHYNIETTFNIRPSRWLRNCGVGYGIQVAVAKSFKGLDCRLRSYRAVSDDADIFELCRRGDDNAVRMLFDEGRASPWDTDSRGFTPLFYAAHCGSAATCRLLISQGADLETRSLSNDTVASYACLKSPRHDKAKQCGDHIETVRLFIDQLEFLDDVNCTGLLGLRRLLAAKCSHEACSHPPDYPAAFYWALPILQGQLSSDVPSIRRGIALLFFSAMHIDDDVELVKRLVTLAGDINGTNLIRWFSPAHYIYFSLKPNGYRVTESARFLIKHGLNLHVLADDKYSESSHYRSIRDNTPTSLMMRYSRAFFTFREMLRDLDIDLSNFVQEELQQKPLVEAGWTQRTLQCLFELDFAPLIMPVIVCQICHDPEQKAAEMSWSHTLERIKSSTATEINIAEILKAREDGILLGNDVSCAICYHCHARRPGVAQDTLEEQDSVFLFPV